MQSARPERALVVKVLTGVDSFAKGIRVMRYIHVRDFKSSSEVDNGHDALAWSDVVARLKGKL